MVPGRRWTDGTEKWRGWAPTIGSVLAVVSPWRAGGTPWHLQASGGGTALGRAGPGGGWFQCELPPTRWASCPPHLDLVSVALSGLRDTQVVPCRSGAHTQHRAGSQW